MLNITNVLAYSKIFICLMNESQHFLVLRLSKRKRFTYYNTVVIVKKA